MAAQYPDITSPGHRWSGVQTDPVENRIGRGRISFGCSIKNAVDFGERKAGEIEIEVEINQFAEIERQKLEVPPGIQRELVVGQQIGLALGLTEIRNAQRRHFRKPQKFGCRDPAMTSQNRSGLIDQDRVGEPEPFDRVGDLPDLLFRMGPRIARRWRE